MGGLGHDFGHESVSEPVSEADSDSDTRFSETSDTDLIMYCGSAFGGCRDISEGCVGGNLVDISETSDTDSNTD